MSKKEEKKPAYLIAGKSTLKLNFLVSVDRITLLGKPRGSIDTDTFMRMIYKKYVRQSFFKATNGYNIVDPKTSENVAYIEVPAHRVNSIRIDFNPKRVRQNPIAEQIRELKWIISQLIDIKFSRLDIAIDILNVDVTGYRPYLFGATSSIIYGRDQAPQTYYVGARSSRSQLRFYNKFAELKASRKKIPDGIKSYWRFEVQLRGSKTETWYEDCLAKLDNFYKIDPHGASNLHDEMVLAALAVDRSFFDRMGKNSQQKYRKMLRNSDVQVRDLTNLMIEAVKLSKSRIEAELKDYLSDYLV